jgi:hypothetical protein
MIQLIVNIFEALCYNKSYTNVTDNIVYRSKFFRK